MLPSAILYLRLSKNIPSFYFPLSQKLSDFSLKLVPVNAQDIGVYARKEKRVIFSFVKDLKSLDKLTKQRNLYLDYYLKNKKVFLMDMNSFGSLKMSKNYLKEEVYGHIPLPLEVGDLVNSLVKAYKKFYGVN
tara:strand:- start:83 stop:481 length:399 start_codon:yes stop_codon:yes gene_type:complete